MKAKLALVGESGFEELRRNLRQVYAKMRCGIASSLVIEKNSDRILAFLPKNDPHHAVFLHETDYKTDVCALREFNVELAEISNRFFPETEQTLIEVDRALPICRLDKRTCGGVFDSARSN